MRNRLLIAFVCWILAVTGCVALMSGCAHPDKPPMTPAGRGLFLVDQYDNLEATYINYLRYAEPEAEAWARANVGATLDRMRLALIVYAEVVAAGGDATESRLEVVELMRQVLLKMAEAKDK
jgi:hypothetical protein